MKVSEADRLYYETTAKPKLRSFFQGELKSYPQSIDGIKRLSKRNPLRFIRWQMLQKQLAELDEISAGFAKNVNAP